MKTCNICKLSKPEAEFRPRYAKCRVCEKEQRRDKYAADPEKARAEKERWYQANRDRVTAERRAERIDNGDKIRADQNRYYHEHSERIIAQQKAAREANPEKAKNNRRNFYERNRSRIIKQAADYRKAHPEWWSKYILEYSRKWARDNRERVNEKGREWRKQNPDKFKNSYQSWKREHPDEVIQMVANRRARKMNAAGSLTADEWRALLDRFGHRCLCCGRADSEVLLTRDHVVPLVLGGANSIENIQPLCRSCNSKKHANTIDYRKQVAA